MSYEMFCKGMSMEEIAKSRDLVTGTIATHLEHYVRMGKIKLEQVVAVEKIEKIRRYQQKNENSGVAGIKAALGDEATRTLPPGGSRWKKPISPSTTSRMPPIS